MKFIYDTPIKKKYNKRKLDFLELFMINHRNCDSRPRKSQDTTLLITYIYNHIAMRLFLNVDNVNV